MQDSTYAEVLGIPVAALGLAGFVGLLVAALAGGPLARLSQATLALSAVVFSAYLLYVQLVVIDAICQWCLATDVLTAALAALALLRLRFGVAPAPETAPARRRTQRGQRRTAGRTPGHRAR